MKSILYLVCIGSLALALTAGAAQDKRAERARPQQRAANVHAARPTNTGRTMSAQRHMSTAPHQQRGVMRRPESNFVANRNARLQTMRERNFARNQAFRERTNAAVNRNRNMTVNRSRNTTEFRNRNRERNFTNRNTNEMRSRNNFAVNRQRNTVVNRTQNAAFYRRGNARITNNWHTNAFRGARYAAFRNYNRQWHDRSWWRSHYNRIVFVNGGWYYWNAGYWFPAWGYAPGVTFAFDGPIYAYNGLAPDQVTVNVQQQLAAAGYYDGPIDGVLGPMTREAIAAYQADNGLAVTSAIDEPTLATMGLV